MVLDLIERNKEDRGTHYIANRLFYYIYLLQELLVNLQFRHDIMPIWPFTVPWIDLTQSYVT